MHIDGSIPPFFFCFDVPMTITEYIKNDLAKRISDGCEPEASLTLVGIAARYSVSVTPIRAVVQELIDEGILRKGSNRRLEINRSHANAPAKVGGIETEEFANRTIDVRGSGAGTGERPRNFRLFGRLESQWRTGLFA